MISASAYRLTQGRPDPRTAFRQVWSTNLVIAMVTGVATNVLYTVGGSDFDAGKLSSVLWLVSVISKLVDSKGDFSAWMSPEGMVEPVIALLLTLFAWM